MKHLLFTILALLSFTYSFAANTWEKDYTTKNTTPTIGDWTFNYTQNTDKPASEHRRVNCILADNSISGDTKTITLTGDICIRYSVFVGSPVSNENKPTTLIIENGTDHQINIWNDVDNNLDEYKPDMYGTLFSVWDNCTLIIRGGGKGKEIIIGGNYNNRGTITNYGFLESSGTFIMEHTIVEHVAFEKDNAKAGECSLIKLHPWGASYAQGQTQFTNVEFRNITMPEGVGSIMYCYDATQGVASNNSTSSSISLTDVYIHDVTQGGTANEAVGNGGLIRFIGEWVGNLNLTRVKFENCTSEASSAGVYWNALGRPTDPCRMTVENCTFDKCIVTGSGQNAGAMLIEGRARFIGETTTFQNCSCPNYGGALYIHTYSGNAETAQENEVFEYELGSNLYFYKNSAAHGGGVKIKIDDGIDYNGDDKGDAPSIIGNASFKITINGAKFEANSSTTEGGALKIDYGTNNFGLTLNLNSGTFIGNSSNNGGAIYSYRAKVSYSSGLGDDAVCEFSGNTADKSGSAMYINQAPYFNMKSVYAHDNTCNINDAAIYLVNSTMTMDNGKIDSNTSAGWGGGLYMNTSTLTINKGEITNNTCNNRGGGIYMINSTLTINDGKINNNTSKYAEFGGGVCAIENSNFTMYNGQINGNSSPNEGGGVYIKGSSFTMTNGEINGNKASSHGGGIYFEGGSSKSFNFSGGSISGNTSGGFGGGVCIYTGGNGSFDITGGNISNNTAANGGGLYLNAWGVDDPSITLTETNIESNTAYLGGGVLMYNGTLNYKKGLIRYNKAIARDGNSKPATMYQVNHCINSGGDAVNPDLSGIGGGIYSTWGKINFLNTNEGFGIYSNTADFGADDLFSNAQNNATIDLPNPTGMTVTGFNVPTSSLHWFEDFIQGDTNFDKKPSTAGAGPSSGAERYRTLLYDLSTDLAISQFQPLDDSGDYIMAALGYNFVYATIAKSGLKKGETAIMNIYEGDISSMSGAKPYAQVALTGGSDGNAQRQILLHPGTWTVVESKWSWSYTGTASGDGTKTVDSQPAITRLLDENSAENIRTFSFSNTKTDTEHNAEECVKNKIDM
ncbi:MAG: hypothetical protein ACI31F_02330 [Muribaculaceae bacterium]